mgnify:CR=1 FL=1
MTNPSYREDHISQIPALMLLIKMGWQYLPPQEALTARGNRYANVLLENILRTQIGAINSIRYKDKEYPFSEANITQAMKALRDVPVQEGYLNANQYLYNLLTLGKSFEQTILGDKKSYSLRYIDWKNPANNTYHVTEEYAVSRTAREDHYRPDVVLFVNGIPLGVMECKSPSLKEDPIGQAISQHLRNQQPDGIRGLYYYSNLLFAVATNTARYGTTATEPEFWSRWKELFTRKEEQVEWGERLRQLKNTPLPNNERVAIFRERHPGADQDFSALEMEDQQLTEQDRLIYSICQPNHFLELVFHFTLYDDGIKKIARYQQYFAVKNTLKRIIPLPENGRRNGGVIWHTQGSGKSLTMVMLAELIADAPQISSPQIILVTDRIDLDDQITETFQKCQIPVQNAQTGKNLLALLQTNDDAVITTLINKFETALKQRKVTFESPNIFVLIDEGHRSQYGEMYTNMPKMLPNACFIAFTGTPLLKSEKNTLDKFGGIIDVYSITDAVDDKAVVPLLYEGRYTKLEVNEKPLDTYFEKVSEPLTDYGKRALKNKFSTKDQLNKTDQVIYARAWDISEHYEQHVKGIEFGGLKAKGQLVAPDKPTALKYRAYLLEIGKVSCEVLISGPDQREGNNSAHEENTDEVVGFWTAMMDEHGSDKQYDKNLRKRFKKQEHPEIIIVVSKLLTGFDAPNNYVLYLTKSLKEHNLLQAIARVNRVAPGKEHGLILDYYGVIEELDNAIKTYSGETGFDEEDLAGTVTNVAGEIKKLPQAHADVWEIFKTLKNDKDHEAYEELLHDEALRYKFYEKLTYYARLLRLALSTVEYDENTDDLQKIKYKQDLKFFLKLRQSVKRRYMDDVSYKEFEPQVRKLIDKHVNTEGEMLSLNEKFDLFNAEDRKRELDKMGSPASKADHIASRTKRAINEKMGEDPEYFKKLSEMIQDAINDYHQHRISEQEYLKQVRKFEKEFHGGRQHNLPKELDKRPEATAIYNLANAQFREQFKRSENSPNYAVLMALGVDEVLREKVLDQGKPIIDWPQKENILGQINIGMDDFLFAFKEEHDLDLPLEQIDEFIESVIQLAKRRYA